jgi:molybdenum cofactor cytidylyltransferase
MANLSTVILAAGASRRLGYSKLMLRIDGEAAVRKTVGLFLKADAGEVIVVTGFEKGTVERVLEGLPVKFAHNPCHDSGMSASVRAALPLIEDSDLALFHLGDKPFVSVDAIHHVIRAFNQGTRHIVVPVYHGTPGHPVLIDLGVYRDAMDRVEGENGLKSLLTRYTDDVLFLESEEGTILDVDTEEDVALLRRRGYTIEKD